MGKPKKRRRDVLSDDLDDGRRHRKDEEYTGFSDAQEDL